MPPKAKFTKEEIIDAAVGIVREFGLDQLTARALSARLSSSARPIFTVFEGMEEVQSEVKIAARKIYDGYIRAGLSAKSKNEPCFKRVGEQYVLFAMTEPKLFQLLFMTEQPRVEPFCKVLPTIEDSYAEILGSIKSAYGLSERSAVRVYEHLWVYTHGIATLCATRTCGFSKAEIGNMLSEAFAGIISVIKHEGE